MRLETVGTREDDNESYLDPVTISPLFKHVTLHTDCAGNLITWEQFPSDDNNIQFCKNNSKQLRNEVKV